MEYLGKDLLQNFLDLNADLRELEEHLEKQHVNKEYAGPEKKEGQKLQRQRANLNKKFLRVLQRKLQQLLELEQKEFAELGAELLEKGNKYAELDEELQRQLGQLQLKGIGKKFQMLEEIDKLSEEQQLEEFLADQQLGELLVEEVESDGGEVESDGPPPQ